MIAVINALYSTFLFVLFTFIFLSPLYADTVPRNKIWIDTDASCVSSRCIADVDDCWAILYALKSPQVDVIGISTVFGNDSETTSENSVLKLLNKVQEQGVRHYKGLGIKRGASVPYLEKHRWEQNAAVRSLEKRLERERFTIIALGPLTNIAILLSRRPDLANRISKIVAVGGQRQPGKLKPRGSLFAFRDLNIWKDPEAFRVVHQSKVPLVLIPFEATTQLTFKETDIRQLRNTDTVTRWLSALSQSWLRIWQETTKVDGFHPFDVLAIGYITERDRFHCVPYSARLASDLQVEGRPILLVSNKPQSRNRLTYCVSIDAEFKGKVIEALGKRF